MPQYQPRHQDEVLGNFIPDNNPEASTHKNVHNMASNWFVCYAGFWFVSMALWRIEQVHRFKHILSVMKPMFPFQRWFAVCLMGAPCQIARLQWWWLVWAAWRLVDLTLGCCGTLLELTCVGWNWPLKVPMVEIQHGSWKSKCLFGVQMYPDDTTRGLLEEYTCSC